MQWINIILQNPKKKNQYCKDISCSSNKIIFAIYLQQPQTLGEIFKNYPKEFI